jgi:hypothetical protein
MFTIITGLFLKQIVSVCFASPYVYSRGNNKIYDEIHAAARRPSEAVHWLSYFQQQQHLQQEPSTTGKTLQTLESLTSLTRHSSSNRCDAHPGYINLHKQRIIAAEPIQCHGMNRPLRHSSARGDCILRQRYCGKLLNSVIIASWRNSRMGLPVKK